MKITALAEGAEAWSGRLTGDVTALKASDLVLKLSLKSGDVFTLTGGIRPPFRGDRA